MSLTAPVDSGIVLFAHGSRIESANDAVRRAAADLARANGDAKVEAAFLELGQPDLEGAVARLVSLGVRDVVVIPYFLTLGIHLERDLPELVSAAGKAHPGVKIRVAKPLDGHPAITGILLDRARETG
jgi:sirohydrochlorin ferrochelatase